MTNPISQLVSANKIQLSYKTCKLYNNETKAEAAKLKSIESKFVKM